MQANTVEYSSYKLEHMIYFLRPDKKEIGSFEVIVKLHDSCTCKSDT